MNAPRVEIVVELREDGWAAAARNTSCVAHPNPIDALKRLTQMLNTMPDRWWLRESTPQDREWRRPAP